MSREHNGREGSAAPLIGIQTLPSAGTPTQALEWDAAPGKENRQPVVSVFPPVRRRESGSRIHVFSFAASVLLTLLAFGAALYGEMKADLLVPFLMLMAAVQLVVQLVSWLHLKNRNSLYSVLSLAFGSIITLVAIGAALYWVWI